MPAPENKSNHLTLLLILLGLIVILPFLLLNQYNHPAMDDYIFANRDLNHSFFETQVELYFTWSGRYFATSLSQLNPLIGYDIVSYKLYSSVMLMLTIASFYFFVSSLLWGHFNLKHMLALCALLLCLYLVQMPDIAQGIYWFSSYMAYHLADMLILLFFGILLRLQHLQSPFIRTVHKSAAFVLVLAIVGSNELSLLIVNASLLLLLLAYWQQHRKLNTFFTSLFFVAFIVGLIVVLAPGNYVRMNGLSTSANLIYSVAGAGLMTVFGFIKWGVVLLAASLIYLLIWAILLSENPKAKNLFDVQLSLVVLWYVATIYTMNFIFIYSTGFRAGTRVENVIYFFFVIGWFYLLQVLVTKYVHVLKFYLPARGNLFSLIFIILFSTQLFNIDSNVTTAYLDLVSGRAATYDHDLKQRYRYLSTSSCSSCPVTPVTTLPKSLYIFNILRPDELDELGVTNKHFSSYWGKSQTYLSGPTPAIPNNMTVLKEIGKQWRLRLFGIKS